jgi:Flp pilus assembly protein TadB
MSTVEHNSRRALGLVLVALLAVAAAVAAGRSYGVAAGLGAGLLGLAVVWGGWRLRARQRFHAVLDRFADRQLTRQR